MARPVRPIPWVLTLPLFLAPAESAHAAAPAAEMAFRAHVESLVENGRLGYEEGLLARFQRVFAPNQLPAELESKDAWPAKSATSLILEYEGMREAISHPIGQAIEGYLRIAPTPMASYYATEHFRLSYETAGPHAIAPADANGDGVPDLAERVGEYAEIAWSTLVDDNGFTAPLLLDDKYDISFREMEAFGYTARVKGGGTTILLHRDFVGFPANEDPSGSSLGSAKVAIAHELKHASQHAASGWSEGGWLEADAMWAEDLVFDETNDYLRYLSSGSPVSDPDGWLRNGRASYEDCLWQHLLHEIWGTPILVDFFARRAQAPAESVVRSFDHALRLRGSSLEETTRTLGLWSYFSGANAFGRPIGFEEAERYPTPPIVGQIAHPAETFSRDVLGMGTQFVLVGGNERAGRPSVSFVGAETTPFALHAITMDLRGLRDVKAIPLVSSKAAAHDIEVEWTDLALLVVVVSNLDDPGASAGFFLSVDDDHAVGVDPFQGSAFALAPNRPNPFRSSTSIAFTLPSDGSVRLSIFDVGGRLVRRLMEGERLESGEHERAWNGLDESGRLSAPGVYYYRLESGVDSATRKMLLLR